MRNSKSPVLQCYRLQAGGTGWARLTQLLHPRWPGGFKLYYYMKNRENIGKKLSLPMSGLIIAASE